MAPQISPLAPAAFPDMPQIAGVRLATAAAGIRYPGRTDVLLALFDRGHGVAGVFTRSKCPSAPVDWCRDRLKAGACARARRQFRQRQCLYRQVRPRGDQADRRDSPPRQPVASPATCFWPRPASSASRSTRPSSLRVMDRLVTDAAPGNWHEAAKAIMTTDTFPKGAAAMVRIGVARRDHLRHRQRRRHDRAGHGDDAVFRLHRRADRARGAADPLLKDGVADTFNAVTIDGDTSTSDTLLAFATGAAAAHGVAKIARLVRPAAAGVPQGL